MNLLQDRSATAAGGTSENRLPVPLAGSHLPSNAASGRD